MTRKRIWIEIGAGLVILTLGILIGMQLPKKPEPIIYTQKVEDNHNVICLNEREYVPYSSITPKARGEYLGYIEEDKQEKIYAWKNYDTSDWIISYSVGEAMLYREKNGKKNPEGIGTGYSWVKGEGDVFCAVIEDISEYQQYTNILVRGLEINDINHRGTCTFSLKEDTVLEWRNVSIDKSQLKVGQTVSIRSVGGASESAPAHLGHVDKVIVLDDKLE